MPWLRMPRPSSMLWLSCQVVTLAEADLLEPERYPRFTLVGQAVGSARLGLAALRKLVPEACPALHSRLVGSLACCGCCKVSYPSCAASLLTCCVTAHEANYARPKPSNGVNLRISMGRAN